MTATPAAQIAANLYVCPQTRAPLQQADGVLTTAAGDRRYPVHGANPNFLTFGPAEDAPTSAQLERLNQLAKDTGWRQALAAVYGEQSGIVKYVTATDRAHFLDLLPLTPDTAVLEIGPGLGQFTPLLARRAHSVCALEVVEGQAAFVTERCRQEGITNLNVATGGDDCRLPYADGQFGLVILNLVFEWCASRCTSEDYVTVQRRMLSEISRVLRPGGTLYLTTKNRYALRYVIGKPDEHIFNMRFGSALPRWLARGIARLRGLGRQPGFLHSHDALRAMLNQAGFDRTQSYWAAPEMRYPAHYVPTDPEAIRQARQNPDFVQGEQRSTRLLMPLLPAPLVKYFTPGLAFVATKP